MILKYPIPDPLPYSQGQCRIPVDIPHTKFLMVAYQRGQMCIWVDSRQRDPEASTELLIQGTGTEPPFGAVYIGSCQNPTDGCVWHVFREQLG